MVSSALSWDPGREAVLPIPLRHDDQKGRIHTHCSRPNGRWRICSAPDHSWALAPARPSFDYTFPDNDLLRALGYGH